MLLCILTAHSLIQYFTNLSSSIQWDLASDYIRNLELLKQMFNPYHIVDEAIDTFKTSHQYTLFEEKLRTLYQFSCIALLFFKDSVFSPSFKIQLKYNTV